MTTYNKIKWIVSYPKSGNTWVRMFLNSYMNPGAELNLNSPQQYVWNDIQPGMMQQLCPVALDKLGPEEQYIYHPAVLLNIIKNFPITYLKTHNAKIAVNYIPVIPLGISDRALYIIRDPRDLVLSLANHYKHTIDASIEFMNNLEQGIEFREIKLIHILLTWSEHVLSWTAKNQDLKTFVVKYEEILADPLDAFTEILKFLNIEYDKDKMVHALEQTTFSNLQKLEEKTGFNEAVTGHKFFRVGKKEQWKENLTEGQIDKINEDHSEVMTQYGYL